MDPTVMGQPPRNVGIEATPSSQLMPSEPKVISWQMVYVTTLNYILRMRFTHRYKKSENYRYHKQGREASQAGSRREVSLDFRQ